MIFLFRSGTVREKLILILRATKTHAQNLAKYATVYKLTMLLLKHMGSEPGKEGPYDTFFAGLLGGYLVFGRRSKRGHVSSVSKQIVIFGRSTILPFSRLIVHKMRFSICPSLSFHRAALYKALSRHNQESRALKTNIPRCMASLRGFKLGVCDVAF
jgi:peroxisomal membrane protein 4